MERSVCFVRARFESMNRFPILHAPLDNACVSIDSEDIDSSDFTWELLKEMRVKSIDYLSKHYPELIFAVVETVKGPKGHDFRDELRRGLWMVADWRH